MATSPDLPRTATDVLVLGAGSAGERLASLLAEDGIDVTVVESRLVGGECPYFACIPSKAMVISAHLRANLAAAHDIGATAAPVEAGDGAEAFRIAARRRDDRAAHHDDHDHVEELRSTGARLVRGRGRVTGPGRMLVESDDGDSEITFERLVIATGTRPVVPDIDGLDGIDAWTYEEAWTATDRPASLLVVGAGAVGCETAQVYARYGTAVTLVDSTALGGGSLEPETVEDLAAALEEDGVTIRQGVGLARVRRRGDGMVAATLTADGDGHEEDAGDEEEVVVERVLIAIGMEPRLDGIGLEALGIDPADGLDVDARGRVDGRDDLWAVGDITGVAPFTHTANAEATAVAANLTGGAREVDHDAIPRTIYTRPEVASVGMTRAVAREAGIDVADVAFDLAGTSRSAVDHERTGRLVLVADRRSGTLVGVSLVAPAAGESIGEFALALAAGVPVADLERVVHPFPTWAEGFGPALASLHERLTD